MVVGSNFTWENELFSFPRSGNEAKGGVEFRHSTHNDFGRTWEKKLLGKEDLNGTQSDCQVSSAYYKLNKYKKFKNTDKKI